MISEDDIEKAVDFLRDNAVAAAQARATRIYLEEFRKSIKAQIMAEQTDEALGAQERRAYSSDKYIEHLEALKTAVFEDERFRFLREAAMAKIEAWRTKSANQRIPL